jgi:HTH-type transcriptional regulator/antitoxin HigA
MCLFRAGEIGILLRVPHNDHEYRQLLDEVGENEKHPLASLMEVIGVLIEKYEKEHVAKLA